MFVSWLALNLVVHESRNIVLQLSPYLSKSVLVRASGHLILELIVSLKDLLVRVGEVILTPVTTRHYNIWSHWRRSNSQILNDHVLRSRYFWAET